MLNSYSHAEIEKLAKSAKEGCEISLNTLIEILNPFMNSLSRHVYVLNYSNEDLYQECVKSLLQSISKYTLGKNTFISFATICIKNDIYCIVRKRVKENFQTSLEKVEFNLSYDVDFDKNLDTLEKNEMIKKLQLAFNELKLEYKKILIHFYFENKKLNEFETDKDPYSLKQNAIKALKKELANLNC